MKKNNFRLISGRKRNKSILISSVIFLLLVIATSVGLFLTSQAQDNRQQAYNANTTTALPLIDRSFFDRKDLIYSSQIPAWGQIDNRFDGHYMLNYKNSCPTCPQLAKDAKIPVVRWMVWSPFPDQINPTTGKPGSMTEEQFNNVINGIRDTLGAYPFIPLQPIAEKPFCPDIWGINNLMKMNKNIIRIAGNRVQLYEIANEPEINCEWAAYAKGKGGQGAKMADYWIKMVPELKSYARSLGFEIYIGGPGFFTGATTSEMNDFLAIIRNEYNRTNNKDLIPDFVSFHIFGDTNCTAAAGKNVNDIPGSCLDNYAQTIDDVQNLISTNWEGVGYLPRLVISGYNISANWTWKTNQIDLIAVEWYSKFLPMLRSKNVFMANLVTMASKEDARSMDLIKKNGDKSIYYDTFKKISINDALANQSRNAISLNEEPKGALTQVTCDVITGWVCDPQNYNVAVGAHIYVDGPTNVGRHIYSPTADSPSDSSVSQNCGGAKKRSFTRPFPENLKDGKAHTIYAYTNRIDKNKPNPQLMGSPKTITCSK